MARDLTSGFLTEVTAQQLNPALLIKAEFDSGTLTFWSGLSDIVYDGDTYLGAGQVMSISTIEETQQLQAHNVTIQLDGLQSSIISVALSSNYQGRPITIWFAVLDSDKNIIADPYEVFSGRMDVMTFDDNGETSVVYVKCESNAIDVTKAKRQNYTPENQKITYPLDEGLDFVPKIADINITWG